MIVPMVDFYSVINRTIYSQLLADNRRYNLCVAIEMLSIIRNILLAYSCFRGGFFFHFVRKLEGTKLSLTSDVQELLSQRLNQLFMCIRETPISVETDLKSELKLFGEKHRKRIPS